MKIALPSRQNQIDSHFGHCEYFTVYTIHPENRTITGEETVASPAGCGCKSSIADTLAERGVKLMLAGNMGPGAVRVLNAAGIEVIRGCSGEIKAVAERWLNGTLTDSGIACNDHEHSCQNHNS